MKYYHGSYMVVEQSTNDRTFQEKVTRSRRIRKRIHAEVSKTADKQYNDAVKGMNSRLDKIEYTNDDHKRTESQSPREKIFKQKQHQKGASCRNI